MPQFHEEEHDESNDIHAVEENVTPYSEDDEMDEMDPLNIELQCSILQDHLVTIAIKHSSQTMPSLRPLHQQDPKQTIHN